MDNSNGNVKDTIPAHLIVQAAKFLEDLKVNVDCMDVEFDCQKEEIAVIDHDGNVVSSFNW